MKNAKLEEEYNRLVKSVEENKAKIEEQLELAGDALNKAVELSEEHGIPFYSGVSFLSQPYVPSTFRQKFENLLDYDCENDDDEEDMEEIDEKMYELFDVSSHDLSEEGWKHSAVCF